MLKLLKYIIILFNCAKPTCPECGSMNIEWDLVEDNKLCKDCYVVSGTLNDRY
jgi:hypothetical protein